MLPPASPAAALTSMKRKPPDGVFQLDAFVKQCIRACRHDEKTSIKRLRSVYSRAIEHSPEAVRRAIPNTGPDEVLLHEDDDCTIYIVRVPAGIKYAPHDHGMVAVVGVFEGIEVNDYFKRVSIDTCQVPSMQTEAVETGSVAVLDADVVHAISSRGSTRSQALHVYLGNLGATDRKLFHPKTGKALPFTMQNYFSNASPPQPVPDGHDQAVY